VTSVQRTLAEVVAALVVLCGGYLAWRSHERTIGAIQVSTQIVRDSSKVAQKKADSLSAIAQDAEKARQAALTRANAQIAAGRALQAHTDSAAKAASEERNVATRLLTDSLATLGQYRGEVRRLVDASRADSVAAAQSALQSQRAIASLLNVVAADSVSLAAERAKSASLAALVELTKREANLLGQQQPSFLGRHASITVGYGCAVKSETASCGPAVVAGYKVLP
jgi:hypothetical protein